MNTLVVPGVRVEARFDVLPPLPATSGILGAVGIVDRPPASGLISVSKASELRDLLGPGTETSMQEVVHALSNGASEVVVSAVAGGAAASLPLLNVDSAKAVLLRARSKGAWANDLSADIKATTNSSNDVVRISLRLLLGRTVVESFDDLQVAGRANPTICSTRSISLRATWWRSIPVSPSFSRPRIPTHSPTPAHRSMCRRRWRTRPVHVDAGTRRPAKRAERAADQCGRGHPVAGVPAGAAGAVLQPVDGSGQRVVSSLRGPGRQSVDPGSHG